MEPTPCAMTLDDFYERIVRPLAAQGSIPHMLIMEAWDRTKKREMTPELAREYAKKIIP